MDLTSHNVYFTPYKYIELDDLAYVYIECYITYLSARRGGRCILSVLLLFILCYCTRMRIRRYDALHTNSSRYPGDA